MALRSATRRLAGLAVAWMTLLGASTAAPATMYLRLPAVSAAPVVEDFTYDAIATVPAVPGTAARALPPDQVEATLMLVTNRANPFAGESMPQRWASLVIVEANGNAAVIRRTTFRDVTVSSVRSIRLPDGSAGEKVRFTAAKVSVSTPPAAVVQR